QRAGMGTTLTAAYVDEDAVSFGHVGDSRAYLFRAAKLQQLTNDHSLVGEMVRRGKLTAEQAEEHPQRSIITRALGPEPAVEVGPAAADQATMVGEAAPKASEVREAVAAEEASTATATVAPPQPEEPARTPKRPLPPAPPPRKRRRRLPFAIVAIVCVVALLG